MRRGSTDGKGTLYDFEGKLIFNEGERMYGRRGFLITFEGKGLGGGPKAKPLQWLVYYTNQRIVGFRDPTAPEVEDIGTLRPFERQDHGTGGPIILEYFNVGLDEIKRAQRRRNDVRIEVAEGKATQPVVFQPLGAAARFFDRLVGERPGEGSP